MRLQSLDLRRRLRPGLSPGGPRVGLRAGRVPGGPEAPSRWPPPSPRAARPLEALEAPPGGPLHRRELPARGDPNRLQQALLNLLIDAVKFGDVGEIVTEVWSEEVRRPWVGCMLPRPATRGAGSPPAWRAPAGRRGASNAAYATTERGPRPDDKCGFVHGLPHQCRESDARLHQHHP